MISKPYQHDIKHLHALHLHVCTHAHTHKQQMEITSIHCKLYTPIRYMKHKYKKVERSFL